MSGRFFRFAIIVVLLLLTAQVTEPYITRLMFAQTTPRPIDPRGDLSDAERSIIALFQRVSPSVVQVVGRQAGGDVSGDEEGLQTGTGFVWDAAGNIVTNNHVINGTNEIVVRLSTGDVVGADIV